MILKDVESRLKSDNNRPVLLDLIESEFSYLLDEAPNSENLKIAIDFNFPEIEQILTGHLPLTDLQKKEVLALVLIVLISKPQRD